MRRDEHVDVHGGCDTSAVSYDETVITGEAVAIDLPLAGLGSRGVAALIDLAVMYAGVFVLLIVVVGVGAGDSVTALLTEILVVVVIAQVGYPVTMETLWRGRTLGKAAMGLRVVRDDGGPIRFRHAFVRNLVGVVLEKPGVTYGVLPLILILTSKRAKRLGDMAAGTIVLQERVPARIEAPVPMPPQLAGWAAALDLSGVDEGLAMRIRQFLDRAAQLNPQTRGALEHQLAAEVTARVGAPPGPVPGWAVLAAVLAERRRRAFAAAMPPPTYGSLPPTPPPAYGAPPQPAPPEAPGPGFAPPG
jgi:uncharacterized RDD family membrane protein YckC